MTTATQLPARARTGTRAAARKKYGFRSTATMEWLKLRSLRSTSWIMLVFAAGLIGLAVLVLKTEHYGSMSAADRAAFDPTNDGFTGLMLGQLAFGVLGVLVITGEFASGMIRSTFAAVPNRPLVLAAKAAVTGVVMLVAGEILAFVTFAVGEAVLGSPAPHATLGQPGVLRAVLMAGAYPAMIGLIGMGLGAIIRNTAAAISAVVGLLFVLPLILAPLGEHLHQEIGRFLPLLLASQSMVAVKPAAGYLPAGIAFGVLCLYVVAALGVGGWLLSRRDA
jgi:ABC-2 type transport system permease protein